MKPSIERWLATHHGVISRTQARELGLTSPQVDSLVRSGRWRRVHHGVYQLAGTAWTPLAILEAAVVAARPGAVVSHQSAAWLHGLTRHPPARPTLTVRHGRQPRAAGVRFVRSRHVPSTVEIKGIRCTEIMRTLIDCAGEATAGEIDDLVDRAIAERKIRIDRLVQAVAGRRYERHPGRPALEERLAARGVTGSPHPSVLESRAARILRSCGLPVPKAEVKWGEGQRYRLDFTYSDVRLVVEVDGWSSHFTPEQQRHDHRRTNHLLREGWTVLHYTWWDVTREPERVAREIADTYRRLKAA